MFESKLNRGKANGYAPLDNSKKVPIRFLPDITYNTLNVCEEDLSGIGTIEDQVSEYLNLIGFSTGFTTGEYTIIIDNCGDNVIDLDIIIYSGSVITVIEHNVIRAFPQDVTLPIELQLGLKSGGTLNVPITILIEKNTLSGETSEILSDVNYNDLSGTYMLLVGQLSVGYIYVVTTNVTFDIPIINENGSGSIFGSGYYSGFGIGLENIINESGSGSGSGSGGDNTFGIGLENLD